MYLWSTKSIKKNSNESGMTLVITLFLVPELATATNKPFPHVTPNQLLSTDVLDVQVIPSGLVITLFPIPVMETATNKPFP